jgi:betaine-aldehyde dehydrogenase
VGIPKGVFNVVLGDGSVGDAMTSHPGVAKVSVTGSVRTGLAVAQKAAANLKPGT